MINTGFSAECPSLLKYLRTMAVIPVIWCIGDDSCDTLSLQHRMALLSRMTLQLTLVFPQKMKLKVQYHEHGRHDPMLVDLGDPVEEQ